MQDDEGNAAGFYLDKTGSEQVFDFQSELAKEAKNWLDKEKS
jgi:hypothetical protein